MRLLLDTQVALWWLTASRRLSKASRELMAGPPCAVSVASIWEVALKHRLGKLPVSPRRFRDEMRSSGIVILSVRDEHVLTTANAVISHPGARFLAPLPSAFTSQMPNPLVAPEGSLNSPVATPEGSRDVT